MRARAICDGGNFLEMIAFCLRRGFNPTENFTDKIRKKITRVFSVSLAENLQSKSGIFLIKNNRSVPKKYLLISFFSNLLNVFDPVSK